MCKFFSAISNGKSKVLFFTLEDIQRIEKEGDKEKYDWNSHTSIAHFHGIKGEKEDLWNKWEYDSENKELKIDGQFNTSDDSKTVKKVIEKYLTENNAIYCQKVYNSNSGDSNSGNSNSGNRNSGYRNSGNRNSGSRNSGDSNSGNWNSGDWNSGNRNSGSRNSGDSNSGNWNSGDWNSGNSNSGNSNSGNSNSGYCNFGYCNSGNRNSGNRNSGNWNSGNWNSGDWNSGNSNSGGWNSGDWNSGNSNSGGWNSGNSNSGFLNSNKSKIRIFNKLTLKKEEDIKFPHYFYFDLNVWILQSIMTEKEKKDYYWYKTTEGYLKKIKYKEAWKKSFIETTVGDVKKTLKLPNFDYEIFEEISGISEEMIKNKIIKGGD